MLKIIKAEYGGKDVKDILTQHIYTDSVNIKIGNYLFGDPLPNQIKYLELEYSFGNGVKKIEIRENENLSLFKESDNTLPLISCKCITYGRVESLEESILSFLQQEYAGPKELIIVNDYPKQKLFFKHPQIKIFNINKTFDTIGDKENFAVKQCSGEIIVVWDDDDIALPNHLDNIYKYFIEGTDLLYWNNGIFMMSHKIDKLCSLGNSGIVYSKNIWEKVGKHAKENFGYDATFTSKILHESKNIVRASPINEEVSWIYNWGDGNYHMSSQPKLNVLEEHQKFIEQQRLKKEIIVGDIQLDPHWNRDYKQMLMEFLNLNK